MRSNGGSRIAGQAAQGRSYARALSLLFLWLGLQTAPSAATSGATARAGLVEAIVTEDPSAQIEQVRALANATDPLVERTLKAWRQGELFLLETNDQRIPFLLEPQTDTSSRSRGLRLADGAPLRDPSGQPLLFAAADLTPVDTSSKLRKAIRTTLDVFAINHANPNLRRDAVVKLGQERNVEYLPFLQARLAVESESRVRRALAEALALTRATDGSPEDRARAVLELGELRSLTSLGFLQEMARAPARPGAPIPKEVVLAARTAVVQIENYQRWGKLFGTAFRGLSLAAVLLVAALGLAITFGLMGVINMAHGELMMIGAYTTFVVQNAFTRWFGGAGLGFEIYFVVALACAFVTGACAGLILERGIIRHLYKRTLESLLATWGVSLVLQQLFRHIFGAANVQVNSPSWLSGSFVIYDVLLAYNRLFVIGFAVLIVLAAWLVLTRTSLGLQIRATMQNRTMASCVGIRTHRVNMLTFALGSGLAGMAGACLSQIGNVGPSLGQNHIVDCFMIVVLGGVGNLAGTVSAALGVGVTDQLLQPWLGAVMGKIAVLAAIILFLQWRPAGLFATRGRGLED